MVHCQTNKTKRSVGNPTLRRGASTRDLEVNREQVNGVYDLRMLLRTSINVDLNLSAEEATAVSPLLVSRRRMVRSVTACRSLISPHHDR